MSREDRTVEEPMGRPLRVRTFADEVPMGGGDKGACTGLYRCERCKNDDFR